MPYIVYFSSEEKQILRNIYAQAYPDATVFAEYTKEEENRLIFSD